MPNTTPESTTLLLIVLFALLIGALFALLTILISTRLKRLENEQTQFWLQDAKRVGAGTRKGEWGHGIYVENLALKRLPALLDVEGADRDGVGARDKGIRDGKDMVAMKHARNARMEKALPPIEETTAAIETYPSSILSHNSNPTQTRKHTSYESRRALLESSHGGPRSPMSLVGNDEFIRDMCKPVSWHGGV